MWCDHSVVLEDPLLLEWRREVGCCRHYSPLRREYPQPSGNNLPASCVNIRKKVVVPELFCDVIQSQSNHCKYTDNKDKMSIWMGMEAPVAKISSSRKKEWEPHRWQGGNICTYSYEVECQSCNFQLMVCWRIYVTSDHGMPFGRLVAPILQQLSPHACMQQAGTDRDLRLAAMMSVVSDASCLLV